jgi:hypothetical protein
MSESGAPPPLKLRARRRLVPELALPTIRGRRRDAASDDPVEPIDYPDEAPPRKPPLYWRVLRLRHVHPNGWQRVLLVEGVLAVALLLVLAGKASTWTLLVLPVVAALLVKANDLIAGGLQGGSRSSGEKPKP